MTLKEELDRARALARKREQFRKHHIHRKSLADPPNYPSLLTGLATRPPWQVAGVDYYVGCPSKTVFKDPSTQGPPGTTYSVSGAIRNLEVNSDNIIIDSFDFSLHSGIGIFVGGNSCTIRNCKFVNGTYGGAYQLDIAGTNCIIQNCTVDGGGAANTGQASLINHEAIGLLTLKNNWFKNFPQQVVENVHAITDHFSILYQFNLIDEGGLFTSVAHLNYMQQNNGICDLATVQYNTGRQVTSVGGETWQFYMGGAGSPAGTMSSLACDHNTIWLAQQSSISINTIANLFHGPNDAIFVTTYTPGNCSVNNNYITYGPFSGGVANPGGGNSFRCNVVFYSNIAGGSFSGCTLANNIDMFNGKLINADNTET